jgi:uncharacterized protein (TIGR03435 family)
MNARNVRGGRSYSITCRAMPTNDLARILYDFATAYMPKPVVDATGLTPGYDFDLHWTWRPAPDGLTIFDAVTKQLGLSLELENHPTPVTNVDSASEKPTPNAPGIDRALPPSPPAEFDVLSSSRVRWTARTFTEGSTTAR